MRSRGMIAASRSNSSTGSNSKCVVPVAPRTPQLEPDLAVPRSRRAAPGPRAVAKAYRHNPLEAIPLIRTHPEPGMEVEPGMTRVAPPAVGSGGRRSQPIATAPDAGPGPRTERDSPLH